jgi:acetyl esterase/lipase
VDLSELDPELRRPYQRLPAVPLGVPGVARLTTVGMRTLMRDAVAEGVRLERTKANGVPVRVYTPAEGGTGAALLWIHGGGMIGGAAVMDDRPCSTTARDLGITVVSVDYRVADRRHPFPRPLDDCLAAWRWLVAEGGARSLDQGRLAIGGQSAGAGLAASLVQRVHDQGGVQPVAQWLFCPMLDDRTAADRTLDARQHRGWNNANNRVGWKTLLGAEPGGADAPRYAVAARRDDLAGLPTTWIGVGDIDLFHAEDAAYAERLRAAGVDVTFEVVPRAPHGFESIAPETALVTRYLRDARAWLAHALRR